MTRKRYIAQGNTWVEVSNDYVREPVAPTVYGDLPGYQSPVTGEWVEGRVQRREDLLRTGSRPWEGMEQETKVAKERGRESDRAMDKQAEKHAWTAWHQLSTSARRALMR